MCQDDHTLHPGSSKPAAIAAMNHLGAGLTFWEDWDPQRLSSTPVHLEEPT